MYIWVYEVDQKDKANTKQFEFGTHLGLLVPSDLGDMAISGSIFGWGTVWLRAGSAPMS